MTKINTNKLLLVISVLACNIFGVYSGDLPSDVTKCKSSDNENCVSKAIMDIFKRYPNGNPEFGLPKISAITLKNIVVSKSDGNTPIQMDFKFNTLTTFGLENIKVIHATGFNKNFKKPVEVEVFAPSLRLKGDYESTGRLLLLPLNGKGKGDIELKDTTSKLKIKFQLDKQNNKTYAKIKKFKAVLEPKRMIVNLENVFMGNPTLSDSINSVINENWRDVWTELQSGINNSLEQILIKLVSDTLKELPIDNFYAD